MPSMLPSLDIRGRVMFMQRHYSRLCKLHKWNGQKGGTREKTVFMRTSETCADATVEAGTVVKRVSLVWSVIRKRSIALFF